MKHEKVSGRQRKPKMRDTHTLKWGRGLTKIIIAHYGSSPSPTGDGQPGGRKDQERQGEKTSALSLGGQQWRC